ncbi:hypothetical protein N7520_010910 [Penicillium odoratum]|uniref:uncharacterized protein n=1 Tax=Penicillium odoratum TaxID=1167516 RepID=UPI0025491763|nr:uncharacterized protein N7520_010910 [Penicillium odoratum]KAJ5745728.1 hypothetical protein N7520_010910 [Penicillium odoratum]
MVVLYDDVLFLILDHIYDTKDRLRLLLVCRQWYTALLHKAYERISVENDQVYDLVCSIQRNPKIGPSIQNLDLEWGWCCNDSVEYNLGPFKDILDQASPSSEHRTSWEKDLLKGESDAWLALLMPSLEAVRTLKIQYPGYSDYFFPMLARAAAREAPFDTKPVLQGLQTVHAECEDNKTAYLAKECLPVLHFPSIRSFSVNSMCEALDDHDVNYSKPAPGTSAITKLDFQHCNGSNGMIDYIKSCANLEFLEYQHDNKAIWGELYFNFRPSEFYTALFTQRHSLRVLRLNNNGEIEGDDEWDSDDGKDYTGFGSLVEFQQLRELRMPLRTLLQFGQNDHPTVSLLEVLPPSLEHLQLAGYRDEEFDLIMKNMQLMLRQRQKRFPNLKRIEIQPVVMERDYSVLTYPALKIPQFVKQAFAPLKMQCDDLAIHFDFTKDGYHEILSPGPLYT